MTQQPLPKHDNSDPWPAQVTPISKRAQERAGKPVESTRARERERARSNARERALSPSQTRIARWLKAHDISGGEGLVTNYGARAVVDALHDGVVHWLTEGRFGQPIKPHWEINPKWDRQGG